MAIRPRGRNSKSLPEILVEHGHFPATALARLRAAGHDEEALLKAVRTECPIDDDDFARAVAEQHGLPYTDLEDIQIQPNVRLAIDRKFQLANDLVPIEMNDLAITVCVADPSKIMRVKMQLEGETGKMIKVVVSALERVRSAIRGKSHGIKAKDDKAKVKELDIEAMWKLFDMNDKDMTAEVFGGKARQLTPKGCTIEGRLPEGDLLRQLTFRKLVMKVNIFLTGVEQPVRAVGHLSSRGHTTETGALRYDVEFDRLPPGDPERIKDWLSKL